MKIETLKRALGKKRLAKIDEVYCWTNSIGVERVELVMKAPFIDDGCDTVVDDERNLWDYPTQKEWIDYIKCRVDRMEFDIEGWNDCWSTVPYENLDEARKVKEDNHG